MFPSTTSTLLLPLLPILVLASASWPHHHPSTKLTLSPINLSSYYTYSTPSAAGPRAGSISFTLHNDRTASTASCSGYSQNPLGQFYSSQVFTCAPVANGEGGEVNATFSYDTYSKVVVVNETWGRGGDVVYTVSASGTLDLQCQTNVWTNPDWQAGELYSNTSMTCAPGSVTLWG